mmetsp:Transcript_12293/g.37011  ORF Transcript_12293/g.37011 Transcript_12293/m.37011 type:complete len:317 (-) Transcript_12293:176-1126(-)
MRGHHGAAVFAACVAALAPPPQHRVSSRRARLAPLRASGAIERVWPEASRALDLLREAADDDDVEPGATYVYEPEGDPWGLVHLVGGAALGTFPQVAYRSLCERVAQTTGLAVVATAYDLTLDHDAAAAAVGAAFDEAAKRWPEALPRFGLGHSLGAKLLLLRAAGGASYAKLVLVAPNNSGVADSGRLLERFVDNFGAGGASRDATGVEWGSVIGSFAKMAGFEVSPAPDETLGRLGGVAAPAVFVRYEDDDLDSSAPIAAELSGASIEWLEGNHLSPVFVRVGDVALGSEAEVDAIAVAVARSLVRGPPRALPG